MPATGFAVLAVIFFLRSLPDQFLFSRWFSVATVFFIFLAVIFFTAYFG
jgi:hypothetical protein